MDVKIRFLEAFCCGWAGSQACTRLGGRGTGSDPRTGPRAGPSYARFLLFLEAWILSAWKLRRIQGLWSGLHALRPEASADFLKAMVDVDDDVDVDVDVDVPRSLKGAG